MEVAEEEALPAEEGDGEGGGEGEGAGLAGALSAYADEEEEEGEAGGQEAAAEPDGEAADRDAAVDAAAATAGEAEGTRVAAFFAAGAEPEGGEEPAEEVAAAGGVEASEVGGEEAAAAAEADMYEDWDDPNAILPEAEGDAYQDWDDPNAVLPEALAEDLAEQEYDKDDEEDDTPYTFDVVGGETAATEELAAQQGGEALGEEAEGEAEAEAEGDDEFAGWDANELAAAILEAELNGETEQLARLTAALEARKAGGGTVSSGTTGESKTSRDFLKERKGKGKGDGKFGKGQRGGTKGNKGYDRVGEGAGGRAGFAEGICKWYAAGFCRNRANAGSCRNGLHSSDAAIKAEADWVAQGPETGTAGSPADPSRPVLLLLDLEGGGNRDGRDGEDEIIEVPVLSMCPVTGRELGRFHRFARPGYWDREAHSMRRRFSSECFNDRSSAVPFPEVVRAMKAWICKVLGLADPTSLRSESFLFVTCGNWDVKTAIPLQCNKPVPGTVDVATQQLLFSRWSNLKEVFRDHYRLDVSKAPTGMRGMLNRLRIPLQGQHHLGMDDVSNLCKILQRLISEKCRIEPTGQAKALGVPQFGGLLFGMKGVGKDKGKGKGKGKCKGGQFVNGLSSAVPPRFDFGASGSFHAKGKGCQDGKGGKDGKNGKGKYGWQGGKGKGFGEGQRFGGSPRPAAPPLMVPPPGPPPGSVPRSVPAPPKAASAPVAPSFGALPKASSARPPPAPPGVEEEEAEVEEEDYDPFTVDPAPHLAAEVEATSQGAVFDGPMPLPRGLKRPLELNGLSAAGIAEEANEEAAEGEAEADAGVQGGGDQEIEEAAQVDDYGEEAPEPAPAPPPAKVPRLASLFASLPAPRAAA